MRHADITVDRFLSLVAQTLLQARPEPVILLWMIQARDQLQRFVRTRTGNPLSTALLVLAIWRLVLDYSLRLRACLHYEGYPWKSHLKSNGNPSVWWFIAWKEEQRPGYIAWIFKKMLSQPTPLTISIVFLTLGGD